MVESIEIGKYYSLKLLSIYGATKFNLCVVGTTNIDNVANNTEKYNIFETFFEPLGLGLSTYYAAIHKDTTIYICNLLNSINPLEMDMKGKVYIPETLINFDGTEEYVQTMKFDFQMGSLYRRFINDNEKNQFITDIKEKIKKRLNGLIEMSINEIEIEVTSEERYLAKPAIDKLEQTRETQYKNYLSTRRATLNLDSEREKEYNETLYNMKATIREYEELNKALELEKQRYSGLCVSLENKLSKL